MQRAAERSDLYRIDISPADAGLSLAGEDKRDAEKLDEYKELAQQGMIYDAGNLNEFGETIRTIIGPQVELVRFFQSHFNERMPYYSKVTSEEFDAINQQYGDRLNDGKNGGDVFYSSVGYEYLGSKVFHPINGNDYRYTPASP